MTVVRPTDNRPSAQVTGTRPTYLDCNATSPVDPRVRTEVLHYLSEEYGNAGSRTHTYGQAAKERVQQAREQVASVVAAKPDEVIFTSGATESNNLALLGLAPHGDATDRRHIVGTMIEHKAVLEPLDVLRRQGFDVTLLPPTSGGWVDPQAVHDAIRPDTLLVSVMAANNETGVIQPLEEISTLLANHDTYLHVDAAQAFGKLIEPLRSKRIDLISTSGHKLYAPKGIGALIARRRNYRRPPLLPLVHGGGQERGLRAGTLPVALIAGLGLTAELALTEHQSRTAYCTEFKQHLLDELSTLDIALTGDPSRTVPHAINFAIPRIDSEAAMLALKDLVAISNGSACTSQKYEPSHVLKAMGLPEDHVRGALRFSWSHLTPRVEWTSIAERLADLSQPASR